jgi:probable F420-dependent oxidoreductase
VRNSVVLFTSDRGVRPDEAARTAEELGFDGFYVPEHTHIPVRRTAAHPRTGGADLPDDRYLRTLDPWVALSMAAAVTSTIRLGTAVALPAEHDPIALAKTIASLDHLSGGRVVLGVGFGWNTDELSDHGVPANRKRTVLREYLAAMQALWSAEEAAYQGEFVRFDAYWAWPKTISQPRPPVLLGAAGTPRTFRWIAESADGWLTTPGEDSVPAKVSSLRSLWRDAGRAGEPEVVVLGGRYDAELLATWADAGVSEVLFGMPDREPSDVLAYLARLVRQPPIASWPGHSRVAGGLAGGTSGIGPGGGVASAASGRRAPAVPGAGGRRRAAAGSRGRSAGSGRVGGRCLVRGHGRRGHAVCAVFELGGSDGADRQGGHDQYEVAQDRGVQPCLALVEAEAVLPELEILLARPSQPGCLISQVRGACWPSGV